ncbi:MAG: shikimate kinase [Bacteroides sp.]|nr:shikimate kinase [Bacteroides sp.]MCM1413975.1 shikimate kinase [Bacteroides sp.]MCM1471808.1 shikimate kinase [Bacteroides sp.]
MQPIFLIGFMGSGKSTLGHALAKVTGLDFIDLDNYIEARYHANVRDIFARDGEAGFRDMERRMLEEVGQFQDVIVACGGGTPCFFDNIELMNRAGLTVLLEASHERLFQRLKLGRTRRPLIAGMTDDDLSDYIARALDDRRPHYEKASARFCADWLDTREMIDKSVGQFLKRFMPERR